MPESHGRPPDHEGPVLLSVVGAGALVGLLGPRPVYAAVELTMALGTLPVASLVGRQRLTSLKKVESCPSALRS